MGFTNTVAGFFIQKYAPAFTISFLFIFCKFCKIRYNFFFDKLNAGLLIAIETGKRIA